ncbi:AAA family ATPase [Sinorhizobium meliloti]|nr:AAA family ATPase [Sinorhizobium meliloti]
MIGDSLLRTDQLRAVEACTKALEGDRWFKLEGPAGTGKTYTVPAIVRRLQSRISIGTTVSHVATKLLAQKVPFTCRTIASLMYRHEPVITASSERARIAFERRVAKGELIPGTEEYDKAWRIGVERWMKDSFVLDNQGLITRLDETDILIIDEHSMVKPEVRAFLETETKCRIGLLGDSFQLPPPGASNGAFEQFPTTYELTDIVRAADTNIPDISMQFRYDKAHFADGRFGQFSMRTLPASRGEFRSIPSDHWAYLAKNSDVIIAPLHRTRMHATVSIRQALFNCGIERPLQYGDRFLVKRRNKYGLENSMMLTLGVELDFPPPDAEPPPDDYLRLDIVDPDLIASIWNYRVKHHQAVRPDDPGPEPLIFPLSMLEWSYRGSEGAHLHDQALAKAKKQVEHYQERLGEHVATVLEYGWAVTVHAIQGAEYDRVIFLYCGWGLEPNGLEARRLAYTGITRARQRILFIRSNAGFFA